MAKAVATRRPDRDTPAEAIENCRNREITCTNLAFFRAKRAQRQRKPLNYKASAHRPVTVSAPPPPGGTLQPLEKAQNGKENPWTGDIFATPLP